MSLLPGRKHKKREEREDSEKKVKKERDIKKSGAEFTEPSDLFVHNVQDNFAMDVINSHDVAIQKKLLVRVVRASNLVARDRNGYSDPYVKIKGIGVNNWLKSRVAKKTLNPIWDETFTVEVGEKLYLEVWDRDRISLDDSLGHLTVRVQGKYLDVGHPFPQKSVEHVQSFKLSGCEHGEIELGLTPMEDFDNEDNSSDNEPGHILKAYNKNKKKAKRKRRGSKKSSSKKNKEEKKDSASEEDSEDSSSEEETSEEEKRSGWAKKKPASTFWKSDEQDSLEREKEKLEVEDSSNKENRKHKRRGSYQHGEHHHQAEIHSLSKSHHHHRKDLSQSASTGQRINHTSEEIKPQKSMSQSEKHFHRRTNSDDKKHHKKKKSHHKRHHSTEHHHHHHKKGGSHHKHHDKSNEERSEDVKESESVPSLRQEDEIKVVPTQQYQLRESTINRIQKQLQITDEIDNGVGRVKSKQQLFTFCKEEGLLRKIMNIFPFEMFNCDIAEQLVTSDEQALEEDVIPIATKLKETIINGMWHLFDDNDDDIVDVNDIAKGISKFFSEGADMSEMAEVQFHFIDQDKDGRISKSEIEEWVLLKANLIKFSFRYNMMSRNDEFSLLGISADQVRTMSQDVLLRIDFVGLVYHSIRRIFETVKAYSSSCNTDDEFIQDEEVITKVEYMEWFRDPIDRTKLYDELKKIVGDMQVSFAEEVKKSLKSMAAGEL